MFDFLRGPGQSQMGNPMGGSMMRMPQAPAPLSSPQGGAALGSSPMNLLPQQPAAQPGQPPMGGLMSLLSGLGPGAQGGQQANIQSILSGLMGGQQPSTPSPSALASMMQMSRNGQGFLG